MKGSVKVKKFSLRALRVNEGLTLEEAAKILGITRVTLAKWESGKVCPRQSMVEKICSTYGYPYDIIEFK